MNPSSRAVRPQSIAALKLWLLLAAVACAACFGTPPVRAKIVASSGVAAPPVTMPVITGKIVERYVGRIPAEAWDRIADLL